MSSSKFSTNVVVGAAAAVGVGVVVGASLAYLSNRLMISSRTAQHISELHDNIIEMKHNLALIEMELGKLQSHAPQSTGALQQLSDNDVTNRSTRRERQRKNVSFSNAALNRSRHQSADDTDGTWSSATSTCSYVTADEGPGGAALSDYETDYFSPDETDDEFFDVMPSDSESREAPVTATKQLSPCNGDLHVRDTEQQRVPTEDERQVKVFKDVLMRVDIQFNSGSEDEIRAAHESLLHYAQKYPDDSELLWRLAKSFRNLATLEEKKGDMNLKKQYIFLAYSYADRGVKSDSRNPNTHKWFAIASGARGEFLGTRERIASGRVFKQHIDLALQYSPDDATLHHLLGRFCYEISSLTWLERKAAAALFGSVPDSSYDEALHHFQAAEDLHASGWKENRLFIAKCLIKLGRTGEVPRWLSLGLQLRTNTADDMIVDKELQLLTVKYPLSAEDDASITNGNAVTGGDS